jgi:hypothetical protein
MRRGVHYIGDLFAPHELCLVRAIMLSNCRNSLASVSHTISRLRGRRRLLKSLNQRCGTGLQIDEPLSEGQGVCGDTATKKRMRQLCLHEHPNTAN